jgi:hypothetical protein
MNIKIMSQIKNVNSEALTKALKNYQETLKTKKVLNTATEALKKAKTISKTEVNTLLEKIASVEKKTNKEIEKAVTMIVNKILESNKNKEINEDVKNEIIKKLSQHNRGKNLFIIIKYVNKILLKNIPTNIKSAKSFKNKIAETLIQDANKTLKGKKVA